MLIQTLIIGAGGFLGANARYWIGGWVINRYGGPFPLHTLLINITGSFLLGLFMTLTLHFGWNPKWRIAVAIGFLGGYTTFSSFEWESLNLLSQGALFYSLVNMIGSVILGLVAVWLGVFIGRALTGGGV